MKKSALLILSLGFVLSGCQNGRKGSSLSSSPSSSLRPQEDEKVFSRQTIYIGIASGDIRVVPPSENSTRVGVSPFNTSIQGKVYYYEGDYFDDDLNVIAEDFNSLFSLYHALSDNHYNYKEVTKRDDRGNALERKDIVNVKYINDHPGERIQVDPFLYDLLKRSYDFTLNSSLMFNRFSESLSSLYEDKLSEDEYSGKALNKAFSLSRNVRFKDDFSPSDIQNALLSVPESKEEAKGCLTFDEEKKAVRLNKRVKDGKEYTPRRNLGGCAKGFATKAVADYFKGLYPDISLRINSGSSSILAVGSRPDSLPWKITYVNPISHERINQGGTNPSELYLQFKGPFNRSTSGYYEHYFYCYDPQKKEIFRRDHIFNTENGFSAPFFDQVSVLLDDAGLADRYTTAIRNCKGTEEAFALFDRLNKVYSTSGELLVCYKGEKGNEDSLYSYSLSDRSPLSSLGYPISILNDGSEYDGDYLDVSLSDIKDTKTKSKYRFSEVYLRSGKRYQASHLFTEKNDTFFPYPDKAISVRKEHKG
mgnify:CR=1 FL=1